MSIVHYVWNKCISITDIYSIYFQMMPWCCQVSSYHQYKATIKVVKNYGLNWPFSGDNWLCKHGSYTIHRTTTTLSWHKKKLSSGRSLVTVWIIIYWPKWINIMKASDKSRVLKIHLTGHSWKLPVESDLLWSIPGYMLQMFHRS